MRLVAEGALMAICDLCEEQRGQNAELLLGRVTEVLATGRTAIEECLRNLESCASGWKGVKKAGAHRAGLGRTGSGTSGGGGWSRCWSEKPPRRHCR